VLLAVGALLGWAALRRVRTGPVAEQASLQPSEVVPD